MDFGSILYKAQENSNKVKLQNESKYYKSKFEPPKKESKDKKLSDNIKKFLQKQEEEQREKDRINRERKEKLLSMRDEKSKNKINKMLKTIKSANKSVLADAVDHTNTALTMQGPEQPDEDDYGYVSQEASAQYSKLMEKYKSTPDEKKKTLSSKALSKDEMRSMKDRVKAAIEREHDEDAVPHRRQRTSTKSVASTSSTISPTVRSYDRPSSGSLESKSQPDREKPKPKVKRPPPPAFDFQQLLKLAEQKQHEPIQLEIPKEKKDSERLMTSKEKKEMEERRAFLEEREKRRKERDNADRNPQKPTTATKPTAPAKMEPNGRIPKLGNSSIPNRSNKQPPVAAVGSTTSKLHNALTKPQPTSSSKSSLSSSKETTSVKPSTTQRPLQTASSSTPSFKKPAVIESGKTKSSPVIKPAKPSPNGPVREFPPRDVIKKKPTMSDVKPRQFPPPDVKSRSFPPKDIPRNNPTNSSNKSAQKRRMVIEDDYESDYDSEMDDFIDDEPQNEPNVSSLISQIFKYDRRKYRDEDFDDRTMESSFAQQMREEQISRKIGIMEDLEDMRQEQMEKDMKRKGKKRKAD